MPFIFLSFTCKSFYLGFMYTQIVIPTKSLLEVIYIAKKSWPRKTNLFELKRDIIWIAEKAKEASSDSGSYA